MLALLNSLRKEALDRFKGSQFLTMDSTNAKATVTALQSQLQIAEILLELPANLKKIEELEEQREHKHLQMVAAREGGSI